MKKRRAAQKSRARELKWGDVEDALSKMKKIEKIEKEKKVEKK